MSQFTFKNVEIKGISTVVPQKELCLLDDKNLYGGDEKKIKRVIESSGFLKRRIVEQNTTTSDLCEFAANDLINALKIDKSTIDGLIFISYTPDYLMPATSYVLHKKLGLTKNCIVLDMPQACSCYVLGLWQASMMINSGCKRILLLVGDTFSKFNDMFNNGSAPVFGDAGSATILEFNANASPIYFNINSSGENYDSLICENGGFRNPPTKNDFYENDLFKYNSKMDGARIFNFTLEKIPKSISTLMNYANKKEDSIDYFILHQANKFILQNIANNLGLNLDKVPMQTISKYGNQCGASIPCAISDSIKNEIMTRDITLLLCGFGVGLSWASAIVNTQNIYCSGILDYKE